MAPSRVLMVVDVADRLRSTVSIKQKDAMDCGPECLAMVVKHSGLHPDL